MFSQASQHVSLIINAGGASRRMGVAKPMLPTPPDNIPLLRHMVERLAPLGWHQTIVVANDPTLSKKVQLPPDTRFLADAYEAMGALGGIATGLEQCPGWALVVATDMPLINLRLCDWLCQQTLVDQDHPTVLTQPDVVVPVVAGKYQPLHALYHVRALPAIRAQLARRERMIVSFLGEVQTRTIAEADMRPFDPDLHSFVNANTPDEWIAAQELLRAEQLRAQHSSQSKRQTSC